MNGLLQSFINVMMNFKETELPKTNLSETSAPETLTSKTPTSKTSISETRPSETSSPEINLYVRFEKTYGEIYLKIGALCQDYCKKNERNWFFNKKANCVSKNCIRDPLEFIYYIIKDYKVQLSNNNKIPRNFNELLFNQLYENRQNVKGWLNKNRPPDFDKLLTDLLFIVNSLTFEEYAKMASSILKTSSSGGTRKHKKTHKKTHKHQTKNIKHTYKKKNGYRKSIRNIRNKRNRTRKT
jgi:hypothetical protein